MSKVQALHADAGPWHYDTECIGGKWEWKVLEMPSRTQIHRGIALTLKDAKRDIVVATGREPASWEPIGPEVDCPE